ncbi:MAG: cation diffusion facilitator family transporter, partial [Candidatus Korarchaeota archaeon]|nr:cation diffusion facilitator family transporter [Candidatus Korarchaeota archaeon]
MERAEGVAIASVVVSAVIVAVKLFVALVTGSMAVLGELLDSLGDILTSSVTLMGIRLSRKPPDADHPYGHAKFDSLLGLLSSIFLMEVEAYVIFRSISALLGPLIPPSVTNETLLLLTATSLVNVARSLALWRTGGSEGVRMMQSEAINYGWDAARTLVV